MNAQWLGSPNFSLNRDGHHMHFDGPDRADASYIVLHTMVGTIPGANARFQQPAQQASAHYGVGLDGRLVQWVKESDAAWHAGDYPMNLDSIGIEHEDAGDYNGPRTPELYATSAQLVADICRRYGIPCERSYIRKHNEVSDAPTGCPDGLAVDGIVAAAQAILNPPQPVDTRPEWVKNLKASVATFVLFRHVDIIRLPTGAPLGSVPPGPLDVAFETNVAGLDYWVTQFGSTVGNGLLKTAVAAAIIPPPEPVAIFSFHAVPPADLPPTFGSMTRDITLTEARQLAAVYIASLGADLGADAGIDVQDVNGQTVIRLRGHGH